MIKQIQLRGISRTPSDRMSEDGGLAESLNMYLDTAEQAPALVPKDVTEKLGLPADLQAERIFIHKTANYENYIVVRNNKIVAYTPMVEDIEPLVVLELLEGENVNDITSIGNTLIITTTKNLYYILYKDRTYVFLGHNVPMPQIELYAEQKNISYFANGYLNFKLNQYQTPDAWNASTDDDLLSLTEKIWDTDGRSFKKSVLEFLKREGFVSPRFVQYVVELNEGAPLVSLPILVGAGEQFKTYISATFSRFEQEDQAGKPYYDTSFSHVIDFKPYSIKAKLKNLSDLEDWKDVITYIKIYISDDLYLNSEYKKEKLRCLSIVDEIYNSQEYDSTAKFSLDTTMPDVDTLLGIGALTYLCKSIPVCKFSSFTNDVKDLSEGINIVASEEYLPEKLYVKERLDAGDMANYPVIPLSLGAYNNRLIAINNTSLLTFAYNNLGTPITNQEPQTKYEVYFIVKRSTKNLCFKADILASSPQYGDLIFCPDQSCSQIIVKAERNGETRYVSLEAKPHPSLACSYASLKSTIYDIDDLYNQMFKEQLQLPTIDTIDERDNSLFISPINTPFIFPIESRYTFQSKIIGIAIANTALSQGQFGQFPLYVFTEDGIWAMETAADGSFVSQKPLSREVCVNADSICAIDNAVVFVTDKAVMLISGSQVMNISPYMNGNHYIPNESALNLIKGQEGFAELESAIIDEEPFMTFMKKAKTAYDYAGQRLIFIAEDESYQYVYKLDTQTWHKVAFEGFDLNNPINSYPECLVLGQVQQTSTSSINEAADLLEVSAEKINDYLNGEIVIVYHETPNYSESLFASLRNLGFQVGSKYETEFTKWKVNITGVRAGSIQQWEIEYACLILGITKETYESIKSGQALGEYTTIIYDSEDKEALDIFEYEEISETSYYELSFYLYADTTVEAGKVYSLSTILDVDPNAEEEDKPKAAKGILITRPFDLGEPDVYKTIKAIKIRGDYDKGNVKYLLQGSDDGKTFYTLSSMRGKSWKMFRLFILADLEPTERISWVDIEYETRFKNRLR